LTSWPIAGVLGYSACSRSDDQHLALSKLQGHQPAAAAIPLTFIVLAA